MNNETKKLAFEVVLSGAINAAQSAVPFLKLPIISQFFTSLVNWIADLIYNELSKTYSLIKIEFQTESQNKEYAQAVSNLETVLSKPKEEQNAEEIEKARLEFKAKLKDLIHLERSNS